MGYIIDSEDGLGYTAPRPNGMAHADGSSCYDGVKCPRDPELEQLAAGIDIEFRRNPQINAYAADGVGGWHPAAADNERLANFLLQHFASIPETITEGSAVDIAMGLLRGMLTIKEAPTAMADPRTVQAGEVRSVDPRTGAEKGVKLARFDLIPQGPLQELAEHFGVGAGKYADNQWRAGYDWSKSYAALGRHLSAFWSGEDIDPDPAMKGASHLAAAAWHVFALMEFVRTFPEGDDRWKGRVT